MICVTDGVNMAGSLLQMKLTGSQRNKMSRRNIKGISKCKTLIVPPDVTTVQKRRAYQYQDTFEKCFCHVTVPFVSQCQN